MKLCSVFPAILSLCFAVILVDDASRRAARPVSGAEARIPRETKVLLLPPIDATVDAARLGPLRQQIVRLRQQYEFISRQFLVLGETMALKAAAIDPAVNVDAKEGRSDAMLAELGKRSGADWIVSFTVQEIASDSSDSADDSRMFVHSTLLIQIWDTRRRAWSANHLYTGRLKGGGSPPEMFIESLNAAVDDALATVLSTYPKVVTVSENGSIVDYLEGQTAPFLGDPAVPFSGLKSAPADGR